MMYKTLSLPLAIGITLLNPTPSFSLRSPILRELADREHQTAIVNTEIAQNNSSTAQVEKSSYLSLMNAGYLANNKQDYLTALSHFQQALKIKPGDSKATKAIKHISSSGFDRYMQAGYAADKIRNYTEALQYFQKALHIRPDSPYATQAVQNISYYLAQSQATTNSTEDNSDRKGTLNIWLMLIGIGVASTVGAGLLFYLFKTTGNSLEESELKDLDATELENLVSQTTTEVDTINSATPTEQTDREKETVATKVNSSQEENIAPKPEHNTPVITSQSQLQRVDIVPELIEDLTKSDRDARKKAVWELAQRGDSRAMKPLVELMVDVDSQERGLILEAMTQIASRTMKPMNQAIMMSLQDENKQVQQNAIRDLTRVYDLMSQVTQRLSRAVENSDAQVQETAKWALKKLNQMPANSAWEVSNMSSDLTSINPSNNGNGKKRLHQNSMTQEQNYPYS